MVLPQGNASRKAAPFATDCDDGLVVPKEHMIGTSKPSSYKPVDKGVPYAKDESAGPKSRGSMSQSDYGSGVAEAVYTGKAGPRLGDSEGKCPWATEATTKPAFDKPPPARKDTTPFATGY
eukprot:m.429776 g.429776  ORF g.429776 m.429776 type:complete len:121 (+) comp17063_c0_seq1:904-1266(+)